MSYDYDKDPLWHTEQKANAFDRVWFYHCDHLGTPQEMSDQTGAIVWSANYKAWGECKTENHTKRDIWDSEIITNNLRFQGQYYDDETGLHYNRYRYYSPYVGRFISKDPIGLLGGHNVYAYAPNPVEWIDPYGLNNFPTNPGLVRRFTTCKEVKEMKRNGFKYDENDTRGGISATLVSVKPCNPDRIKGRTGALAADCFIDIDTSDLNVQLKGITKGGLPDWKIKDSFDSEHVVNSGRVSKKC